MNLSLLIIIVMLAIVIPALARYFFFPEKPRETYLEPQIEEQKSFSSPVIHKSEILDADSLLNISSNKPVQKELISNNLKIFATGGRHFRGYELLQALQDVGLSYGEKNLFHYVKEAEILFSVAPTSAPYVFYLDEIGSLSTEGLEFILKKDEASGLMQETAEKLSEALGEGMRAS